MTDDMAVPPKRPQTPPCTPALYCSFCGKSQHEVADLVCGPTVFICNECVVLCSDIIATGAARRAEGA